MKQEPASPMIISFSWGKISVEGFGSFKDVKLFPGGCHEWDWRETGTRHSPGIQIQDIDELLSHNPQLILFGTGVFNRLKLPEETREYLNKKAILFESLPTKKAIERYNELVQSGKQVAALIHSTC